MLCESITSGWQLGVILAVVCLHRAMCNRTALTNCCDGDCKVHQETLHILRHQEVSEESEYKHKLAGAWEVDASLVPSIRPQRAFGSSDGTEESRVFWLGQHGQHVTGQAHTLAVCSQIMRGAPINRPAVFCRCSCVGTTVQQAETLCWLSVCCWSGRQPCCRKIQYDLARAAIKSR